MIVKHRLPLLFLSVILLWALSTLFFKVNYWQNHDGNYHLQRIFAATDSLRQKQFPLRWSRLLNYNCGLPVFNFYYPLIYYFTGTLGLINISPVISLKIILALFYIFGTVSFYFLIYYFSKSTIASLIGATLFALNPYYLQLIYVRANPELLTYCILPAILLCIFKSKYLFLFISLILYFLSHNTTVLITLPIILISISYFFYKSNYKNNFIVLTFIFAFLSSSFFLGPALIEKKYVKLGSDIAANYQEHFPSLKQLIFSPWGWGYSTSDLNDGMSFKFGYIQFFVLFIGFFISFRRRLLIPLVLSIFFILFLTLPTSLFIWKIIPTIQQLQYPWRFLGLTVFLVSLLASFVYKYIPRNLQFLYIIFIIFGSIYTNRHHIQAFPNLDLPDFNRIGSTTIADEILPINATKDCYQKGDKLSYFPDAYIISDHQKILNYQDCSGYVCLDSENTSIKEYTWKYKSTFVEKIFNYISIFSLIIWSILAFFKHK